MQLTAFVDAGGTLVDTADVYCDGESERTLGPPAHRRRPARPTSWSRPRPWAAPARADGPRRLPRAPARRAGRLAGAARAWTTSTCGSCTPGTTRTPLEETLAACDLAVSSGRARYVGHQQLHRLADRAGRDLAARLARPHAAGQHPGRVLAAAARRGARGRAGRRGARAGRAAPGRRWAAGVLTGKYRHSTPSESRGASPQWQGFIDGLRSAQVRPDRRGGDHRRRGPGHHARWRSRWPGCATGRASSRRSSARAPPSSCRPRSTPTASGCPRRSAPRWRTSPLPRSAIPSAGADAVSARRPRAGRRPGLRRLLRRRAVARPGHADGGRAARRRHRRARRRHRRPAGQAPQGRPAARRAAVLQLPGRPAHLRGRRAAGRRRPGGPAGRRRRRRARAGRRPAAARRPVGAARA